MENNNKNTSGLSLGTMLFVIFLILKLANVGTVATWSWLWVTSPLWISLCLAIVLVAIMVVIEKRK
jgi:membrane protein YdbS with pleckstrin-like domain